jgi:hypothetical protein
MPMKSIRPVIQVAVLLAALYAATAQASDKPGLPHTLPPELETEIALSAAPKHLRDDVSELGRRPGMIPYPGGVLTTMDCRHMVR